MFSWCKVVCLLECVPSGMSFILFLIIILIIFFGESEKCILCNLQLKLAKNISMCVVGEAAPHSAQRVGFCGDRTIVVIQKVKLPIDVIISRNIHTGPRAIVPLDHVGIYPSSQDYFVQAAIQIGTPATIIGPRQGHFRAICEVRNMLHAVRFTTGIPAAFRCNDYN